MNDAFEAKEHGQACAVCGCELKRDKAIIGRGETLCMGPQNETIGNCFGWFSGYPWVLFEEGFLVSDLEAEDIHMSLPPEYEGCLLCYNLMQVRCVCAPF